MQITIFRDLVL